MEQYFLNSQSTDDGTPYFEGNFSIEKDLDVAGLEIPALVVHLALVSANKPRRRSVSEAQLSTVRLNPAWNLGDQLQQDPKVVEALWKQTKGIYLKDPKGYLPGDPGEVRGLPCASFEGHFSAPDIWTPHPLIVELPVQPDLQKDFHIFCEGPYLLLKVEGLGDPVLLDRQKQVSGQVEEGWKILDAQRTGTGIYLLLTARSRSRPDTPSGYCGGGEEEDLIWLHLHQNGQIRGINSELIESCFQNIELFSSPHKNKALHKPNSRWQWAYEFLLPRTDKAKKSSEDDESRVRAIEYDPTHPERGLVENELSKDEWDKAQASRK